MTVRLAPTEGRANELRVSLKALIDKLATTPGLAGAHLLQHETPAIEQTTEQKIRGAADQVADWVLVVCAYSADALAALADAQLSSQALLQMGAADGVVREIYALSCSATAGDIS